MANKKTGTAKAAPKAKAVVEQEVIVAPEPKVKQPKKPEWELKDRTYFLVGNKQPLITTIPGKHTEKRSLLWFDPDKGFQRELRYATNQPSPFVDEQEGPATLQHIVFRNGTLPVPSNNVALQKLLSL